MTTTCKFQIKPDFYSSEEDCIKSLKTKIQTNKRYKNFNQTHFTAGDEEQFNDYKLDINGNSTINDNVVNVVKFWKGYENLETVDVLNTFRYMFNKFKKGIFVKIINNELKVFLPFSNANYINEWSDRIDFTNHDLFKFVSSVEGYTFNDKHINNFKNTWYANNCLIRYEYPIHEGDTNVSNIKNMLEELCTNRKLPDIEFFINRRDFPLLTKNYCEPYYDLWDSYNYPLVSHHYNKYVPILSMSKTEHFADILIPTHEDWARIQLNDNKWFCKARVLHNTDMVNWDNKINVAVFRGSSTGSGVTIKTNQRLHIAHLSSNNRIDTNDNLPFLDAGITKWNMRIKKLMGERKLQVINKDKLPFSLVSKLSYGEQSKYKYIIHIDGHTSAFRLSNELKMNSVILIVKSKWKMWYSDLLKPYVHYVPVKDNLSDIYKQIIWCKNNDDKCKKIVENANMFYNTHLSKTGVLDYMETLLHSLKQHTGSYYYNSFSPLSLQIQKENNILQSLTSSFDNTFPNDYNNRSFDNLLKIQKYLNEHSSILLTDSNETIFENSSVKVEKHNIFDYNVITKTAINDKKKQENTHEAFIGLHSINNIIQKIPNFSFVFGYDDNTLITEYINGESLFDYIKSKRFNLNDFIFILLQLCLAIKVAQNECYFVHYDLTSWNIVLQKQKHEIDVEYEIDGYVYSVRTNIVPVIIDYGKSHVIYKNEHYGFVKMYNFSSCQDILTLLLTSLYQILIEQDISKSDFTTVLKVSNFITNTKYRRQRFFNSKDLKSFLRSSKKYSNLLYSNKYELEDLTPMDLFRYITQSQSHNNISIKKTRNNTSSIIKHITPSYDENIFYTFNKLKSFIDTYSKYDINDLDKLSLANLYTLINTTKTLFSLNIKEDNNNRKIYEEIYNYVCKLNKE